MITIIVSAVDMICWAMNELVFIEHVFSILIIFWKGKVYQGNFMESTGDRFLSVVSENFCYSKFFLWSYCRIIMYIDPLINWSWNKMSFQLWFKNFRYVYTFQIRFCMSFTYWTSPVVLCVLYRRGYFSTEGLVSMGKFMFSIGVIYTVAYITRGNIKNVDF